MRYALLFLFVASLACSETSLKAEPTDAGGSGSSPEAQAADTNDVAAPSQDTRTCTQTSCLGEHRYLYQIDRIWEPTGGSSSPQSETEYQPVVDLGRYLLSFSPDGEAVVLARVEGKYALEYGAGAVAKRTDASATYKLANNWAGAELIVTFGSELKAELSVFGSGVPVVEITRGTMSLTVSYEPGGEACSLPAVQPNDQYLPATYGDALSKSSVTQVPCAGLRDGYCDAGCMGWLVAIFPGRDFPLAAAYDPVSQKLVGWKIGAETYGICRGTFPPLASNGSPGWNTAKMDRSFECQ